MSQLENLLAAFPGPPPSPLYGTPLEYLPGIAPGYAPISAMHHTIAVPVGVKLVGDRKFAVLDPNADIPDQLARVLADDFKFVELGMPGTMRLGEFMMLLTHIHGLGLGVIARNAIHSPGPFQYLSHPNVFGCVVERGKGGPLDYDCVRRDARRDGLMPIWFVLDGAANADQYADEIRVHNLKGIGVSYAAGLSGSKYDDSHSVLTPIL